MSLPANPSAAGSSAHPKAIIGVSLKMYFGYERTLDWCRDVAAIASAHPAVQSGDIELFVLPALPGAARSARGSSAAAGAAAGAQDIFWEDEGRLHRRGRRQDRGRNSAAGTPRWATPNGAGSSARTTT